MSEENVVLLKNLADELKLDRSNMRRYAIKNGFELLQVRAPGTRGQLTLALPQEDAERLKELRRTQGYTIKDKIGKPILNNSTGWFYVIQLIPELEAGRIKLGFAKDVNARLNAHRIAAPTANLLKIWPCKRNWETTAIASLTRKDCEPLSYEVFKVGNLKALVERGNAFFTLMPDQAQS